MLQLTVVRGGARGVRGGAKVCMPSADWLLVFRGTPVMLSSLRNILEESSGPSSTTLELVISGDKRMIKNVI